jgi:PKD domain
MNERFLRSLILCLCLLALRAAATTYYVDINNPNPTPPYTSWNTAATNLQDAIAETADGDLVLVNPGIYHSSGYTAPDGVPTAAVVTNAIDIQGVSGAETLITGSNTMRCIYLASGATLAGFTLTEGYAQNGGGIYCAATADTVISNCVIIANSAGMQGGGAYQGTFVNCTILRNEAYQSGGGFANAAIFRSLIVSNQAYGINFGFGGGAYDSSIFSSALAGNFALSEGGGAYGSALVNCTVTANTAQITGGGGTASCSETNCIDYYNRIYADEPTETNSFSDQLNYCCTIPNPGGNSLITNAPVLADISHISLDSPCRGAGETTALDTTDIDGNPWNNPPSIGCSEIPSGGDFGSLVVNIATPFTNWAPGYSLSFQTANSGPDDNSVWNFGDGTIVTNTPGLSHTWSVAGTYPVTLTAYNDSYPAGVTATQLINIAIPSVYYVNLNNFNPVPPYMTWATAAVNIQDAVSVAATGSLVLVTNGPTGPYSTESDYFYLTNSAAFYLNGGATAPDGNFYRVVITNAITVESVNGPAGTYIWGPTPSSSGDPFANCVYLANGATLSGFTMTNESTSTSLGQVSANSTGDVLTNCVMTHYVTVNSGTLNHCSLILNSSSDNSFLNNCIISNNCQVLGGVLNNCILVNNTNSMTGQGGAATALPGYPLILNSCIISNNASQSSHGGGYGGGVYNSFNSTPGYYTNCILNNCILTLNSAQYYGGGAYGAELNNCLVSSNSAPAGGGIEGGFLNHCIVIGNSNNGADGSRFSTSGTFLTNCTLTANVGGGASYCALDRCTLSQNIGIIGAGALNSILNNCLIISNFVTTLTGSGGGAYDCTLTNCVIADNAATNSGGAYKSTLVNCTVVANTAVRQGGGVGGSSAQNCILYYNINGDHDATSPILNYCCTPVLPTSGFRNITNAPLFVNLVGGDFHLQPTSACINSGNNAYIRSATDLDGNPRIAGGTGDIGAYEYPTPTSAISYAYLQQYGLPTDGSVDSANLDGTAFNVYQDWVAGLNPTNSTSILAMLTPVTTNTTTGVTITWQSVSGILYFLQRSTNLVSQPPFVMIQNNLTGKAGTTSYTDTTATTNVPYFYRVGVVAP